jgi:hypothetical protein
VVEAGTETPLADASVRAGYSTVVLMLGLGEGCTTYHVTSTDSDGHFVIPPKWTWNIFVIPLFLYVSGGTEIIVHRSGYEPGMIRPSDQTPVVVLDRRGSDGERDRRPSGFCGLLRH